MVHGNIVLHVLMPEYMLGKRDVLGYDIENFFPSIGPYSVFNMFRRLKCSPRSLNI